MNSARVSVWPESERYLALSTVVDSLVGGPTRAIGSAGREWLVYNFSVGQKAIPDGPLVNYMLFDIPNEVDSSTLGPALRRLTWDLAGDRSRCHQQVVAWPNVAIEYFELRADENRLIETRFDAFKETLAHALNEPDVPRTSPIPTGWKVPGSQPNDEPARRQSDLHSRTVGGAINGASIKATFVEGSLPATDGTWKSLWGALEALTHSAPRIDFDEEYPIPPKDLAALLTRNLT